MYKARIRQLEESYNTLSFKITAAETADPVDTVQLAGLRNQRQIVLNELSTFRRLQWEHDHETINMDDDR